MSTDPQPPKQSLTVLPSSGRVEQLRREMAENPPTPTPAPTPAQATTPAAEAPPAAAATPSATFRDVTDPANAPAHNPNAPPEHRILEGKVIEAVRQVYDPEIPVNIYELGLIYAIDVRPDLSVNVRMTLTTPACPVAGSLPGEVERRIEAIPEVTGAKIELVWDPPWDRSMMSEAAMLQLGMF